MTDCRKSDLRRRFTALRDHLTGEERTAAEEAIRERLFSLPAWREAPLVCGYTSIRSEIAMNPVWERAAAEGRGYALPVTLTSATEGRMIFRRVASYAPHELVPARFGVPEPSRACPTLSPAELEGALILVPGLAFDDEGYRLGYGGGYYDRFLADLRAASVSVTTVGLAFSRCRTPILPHEAFDLPVDCIIDERRVTFPHGIPH